MFFTGRMPFLPPNQQCQRTEGNYRIQIREKTLEFSSTVLPAPSPYRNVVYCNVSLLSTETLSVNSGAVISQPLQIQRYD